MWVWLVGWAKASKECRIWLPSTSGSYNLSKHPSRLATYSHHVFPQRILADAKQRRVTECKRVDSGSPTVENCGKLPMLWNVGSAKRFCWNTEGPTLISG